jgi:hypothetical protein
VSATGWAEWRVAERGLAGDVDAAARTLPARQAWCLRALAALDAGDRAALEALMTTAPREELRAVAELALSEPGSIDPSRFRAHLKRIGVRNSPLPRLDLLRLACVAHNRERPSRPQKLADASRGRPALEAALMVLSPLFKPYKIEARLLERSQRLASYWAAGIGQHVAPGAVRAFVRNQVAGVEPLAEERWPDLEDPHQARGKRASPASLAEFLRDPVGRPWSDACVQHVRVLCTRSERAQRLAALGGLLDAIDILIRESTPVAAIPAVAAALELAQASPEVAQRNVLFNQLLLLHMRLLWSSGQLPEEMSEPLWRGLDGLSPEERAWCARLILESANGAPLPSTIAAEVLAFAIRGGADWEEEVLPWIFAHGGTLDVRRFQAALTVVPGPGGARARAQVHAAHRSTAEACRLAARMFERGAVEDATLVTMSVFGRELQHPARGRQERRLRQRGWLEVARAAAACSPPPGAELVVGLITISAIHSGERQSDELLECMKRCADRRLALPPEPDQRDLIHRLQLMTVIGLDERAQTEFREFGRWLRRSPAESAIPAALRVCAGLCADEEIVAGYERDGEEPPAPGGDPRLPWLRSLTAWLDRHETGAVGRCAVALARDGSASARHLDTWYSEVSELGEGGAWDEVLAMVGEEELEEPFLELLEDMEKEPPF